MRTLYLECSTGVSGDMLLGALADLLDDPYELEEIIASAGIPGVTAKVDIDEKSAVTGIRVHIAVDGREEGTEHSHDDQHHENHHLDDVLGIINSLNVSDRVRSDAAQIYTLIAEAESEVHGQPVKLVHFHEVGALDAVADIVGVCLLIERLAPAQIIASPIRTGYGQVKCAHGILPVPAPATAQLIRGLPVYAGDEEGEFCTPTGAALIRHFAERFEQMPLMQFDALGYGLGSRNFQHANMLRAYIGDVSQTLPAVTEIQCNIDDMTPEDMGGVIDLLMTYGALDASIIPAIMKKARPGYLLTCICRPGDADDLAEVILAHTSTIGLRLHNCERYEMVSHWESRHTDFGDVRVKISDGYGVSKCKPEYEDSAAGLRETTHSQDVRDQVHLDPKDMQ